MTKALQETPDITPEIAWLSGMPGSDPDETRLARATSEARTAAQQFKLPKAQLWREEPNHQRRGTIFAPLRANYTADNLETPAIGAR